MSNHTDFEAMGLTEAERATNFETMLHIDNVRLWLTRVRHELDLRAEAHDQSKLHNPEVGTFVKFTPKLKSSTYGSDEYKGFLAAMKPALDNHYACNAHHPEHHKDGIDGMTLVDLVEMLCDWKAATLRHANGDLDKSLGINSERFGMAPQLVRIFRNTVEWMKTFDESEWHRRGRHDAAQDSCENIPFAGVCESNDACMRDPIGPVHLPDYVPHEHGGEYLKGYMSVMESPK